ncbi:MAG: LLM class flavin-dependent oxidoreductase [Oscillochloris sp.]|nr:LLM class flavin-dependent oxidoreductase [Oscillochloris sp.]
MKFAVNLPILGEGYSDPKQLMELARDAEQAGWDAVYVWDALLFDIGMHPPVADPWIALAAIATVTSRVQIGTMIAQLARRRPAKVARELVTLDHLSSGRMMCGVGLGFSGEAEFAQFGEDGDPKVRAEKLDEALTIIRGLTSGEPFGFGGKHFKIAEGTVFLPKPVQPKIPIIVGGYWPNKGPFRRAARWDGMSPAEVELNEEGAFVGIRPTSPSTVKTINAFIAEHRTQTTPFEMIISRVLPEDPTEAAELIAAYAEAKTTCIMRDIMPWAEPFDVARTMIRRGPPVQA